MEFGGIIGREGKGGTDVRAVLQPVMIEWPSRKGKYLFLFSRLQLPVDSPASTPYSS